MKFLKTFRIDRYATIAALTVVGLILTTSCAWWSKEVAQDRKLIYDELEKIENEAK